MAMRRRSNLRRIIYSRSEFYQTLAVSGYYPVSVLCRRHLQPEWIRLQYLTGMESAGDHYLEMARNSLDATVAKKR